MGLKCEKFVAYVNNVCPLDWLLDGNCQYQLADLPKKLTRPGLVRYYGTPWFCSGYDTTAAADNFGCYKFYINNTSNFWKSQYTSNRNVNNYMPHVVYDHLYFLGDGTTSVWGPPPVPVGSGACWVSWQKNLIVLGGVTGLKAVQLFTFSTSSWTVLTPMSEAHSYFACLLLPNGLDQVLVLSNEPGIISPSILSGQNSYKAISFYM